MATLVWKSIDGSIFDCEQNAVNRDIVIQVSQLIVKAAQGHNYSIDDIPPIEHITPVVDILVMTDVLHKINKMLGVI